MILVDMNQISLACLMMSLHMNKGELDEEMVRHMILNSIRGYRTMFKEDYGEIVLTYDSRAYWRKQVFPQYKANRKKGREEDGKDWDSIFGVLNQIKEEIRELEEAVESKNNDAIQEEIGDLYMIITNLSEKLGIDSEESLRKSNVKFEKRFNYIEKELKKNNIKVSEMDLDELNTLWDDSKKLR